MNTFQIILTAVPFTVFVAIVILYNGLIRKRNAISYALSSIDAYLKKRHDLIPNLIATVKEYMKYERSTLTQLTELRAKAITGNLSPKERIDLESQITAGLQKIVVSAENYPELKSSSNFLQLQAALNEIEEQLSAARRALSAAITEYNNAIRTFPSNLMAKAMGYTEYEWFAIREDERVLPNVKELFKDHVS